VPEDVVTAMPVQKASSTPLKVECIHGESFASKEIMRTAVFDYTECDYNWWRRHIASGGLSPEQFENQNLA
jgi:putative transposase